MSVELVVPEVGESITEVQIGKWHKKEGDFVKKDETLVEIESDKVTLELPAPVDGTLKSIGKQTGDEAEVGDVIGQMQEGEAPADSGGDKEDKGEKKSEKKEAEADEKKPGDDKATQKKTEEKAEAASNKSDDKGKGHVMPSAQRLISENRLKAGDIDGTGPGGRVLKEDVLRHIEQREKKAARETSPTEGVTIDGDREEQVVPMTPLRRRIAERLVEAQQDAALLTTFNEIDMSGVMSLRSQYQPKFSEKYGIKLGFMSFFTKAVIEGLKAFPAINAEVRGDDLIYRNYYDIGIAIGGGKGLVVPVIRSAERLSFAEIELAIAEYAGRAKENKLQLSELQGGTFTITNGGIYGSLLSTPIVNPPQSGVLGMHSIQKRPVVVDDQIVIRPMMYVALTYDHRVVDGREAVSFLVRVKETLEDPARMLLEV